MALKTSVGNAEVLHFKPVQERQVFWVFRTLFWLNNWNCVTSVTQPRCIRDKDHSPL